MSVAIAEPIVTKTLIDTDIHEPLIEILDAQSREVITVIEILSPSNKILGAAGRESYLRKRIEVLKSKTHLVEIDLLRVGRGFVSTGKLRGVNYSVHVSRAGRRPEGMLWKIRLPQKLPVISIPLKAGDDDVPLDLQEVFASVYDLAGFDLVIDYRGQPEPGLDENQAKWVDQLLKSNGLR